ncbi:MAG: hypothetical protein LBK68_04705 [Candidatus Margulisbacteria bacterium]|jgi:hypothetical protein|nr:hypothetical protein [Candidatus Margulisiibacteriota bacterium]
MYRKNIAMLQKIREAQDKLKEIDLLSAQEGLSELNKQSLAKMKEDFQQTVLTLCAAIGQYPFVVEDCGDNISKIYLVNGDCLYARTNCIVKRSAEIFVRCNFELSLAQNSWTNAFGELAEGSTVIIGLNGQIVEAHCSTHAGYEGDKLTDIILPSGQTMEINRFECYPDGTLRSVTNADYRPNIKVQIPTGDVPVVNYLEFNQQGQIICASVHDFALKLPGGKIVKRSHAALRFADNGQILYAELEEEEQRFSDKVPYRFPWDNMAYLRSLTIKIAENSYYVSSVRVLRDEKITLPTRETVSITNIFFDVNHKITGVIMANEFKLANGIIAEKDAILLFDDNGQLARIVKKSDQEYDSCRADLLGICIGYL